MVAIEALCKKTFVLDNGKISFVGETTNAIKLYLKTNNYVENSLITSKIQYLHPDFVIENILINGTPFSEVYFNSTNTTLLFQINGIIKAKKTINIELRFFDTKNNLIMLCSPGHYTGINKQFDAGPFCINKSIVLPKNITKGDYYISLGLTHPNIESYLEASYAIHLISEGIKTSSGIEFNYNGSGFLILE
jgi:lipopolysaccharide transport system ATP-binding protein